MPLSIPLDRTLPIPLSVQLKGQIEFSVVVGTLRPGERRPTVLSTSSHRIRRKRECIFHGFDNAE